MSDNSTTQNDQSTETRTKDTSGSDAENRAGPTPADAIGSPANSARDAASGSISESKARDPEYYAERDIPSE